MEPSTAAQTILGIFVLISMGLASWALKSIVALSSDQKSSRDVAEERKLAIAEKINELKADIIRSENTARSEADRMAASVRTEQTLQYGNLQRELARLEGSVTAIHKRLDRDIQNASNS